MNNSLISLILRLFRLSKLFTVAAIVWLQLFVTPLFAQNKLDFNILASTTQVFLNKLVKDNPSENTHVKDITTSTKMLRPGDDESKVIDEMIFKILNTPSGLRFCGIAKNDFEDFGSIFFINKDSTQAKNAFEICKNNGKFYTPLEGTNGYSLIPKKYFIAGHSDKFLGWTSNQNETLLFYKKDEIRTDNLNLLRTLIHELTVSYDQKEWLGSYGKVIPPELGISEIQSKDIVFPFIRNIYIRYAFTMARAIHREQIIINELGLDYSKAFPKQSALLNMNCQERVKSLVKSALNYKDHLNVEAKVFKIIESNPLGEFDNYDVLTPMVDLLNLYTLSLKNSESGSTQENVKLCEYLSSGDPYFPVRMNVMGGPDPKTTGGF